MSLRIATAALVAASFGGAMAWAGHELPIYPSFYPHEIYIQTVAPERALALLEASKIQAYDRVPGGAIGFGGRGGVAGLVYRPHGQSELTG
jgi:hypothetical protein